MKYNLSILIPGIRPTLWKKVYDSLVTAYSGNWEVIFSGPQWSKDLDGYGNVTFLASHASPIVARQKCLIEAKGDWICYAADDCTFLPGTFDRSFSILKQNVMDKKTVIVGKYLEDVNEVKLDNPLMRQDPYWSLSYHTGLHSIMKPHMKDYYLINTGLVSRHIMLNLGGWDCQFEACAMACVDLSLRIQDYGVNCILQNEPIFTSTHLPGHMGDHGPIHDGQTQHDEPLFFKIWGDLAAPPRTCIDINNWKQCPERWERRFGKA